MQNRLYPVLVKFVFFSMVWFAGFYGVLLLLPRSTITILKFNLKLAFRIKIGYIPIFAVKTDISPLKLNMYVSGITVEGRFVQSVSS